MDPTGKPTTIPLAPYNINATHLPSSHASTITSVSIFSTPSHTQYILITTNQTPGSPLLRTFIAPLGASPSQYRPLPPKTTSRQILSASTTPSGRFIILVEKDRMRVLTTQAVYDGGLTCSEETVEWKSSLGDTAKDRSAIALSVKEEEHAVSVMGVDGRGHFVSARKLWKERPG
ncbi:hypothetical protein GRF29_28g2627018 [Pseudopithomyces chartarum]|uniref:Uncharacterized protein n=1 Tax=Pseudopithomyces chartarum TaxID=1892770 RepID=A0AAN6RL53_9PLEO|nr:hypothetical protein GRF29_28g2627018 [Pseudopithomyces chartarum]